MQPMCMVIGKYDVCLCDQYNYYYFYCIIITTTFILATVISTVWICRFLISFIIYVQCIG